MTTMTATSTQVYQVFIRATPEAIWEAITTPEFTARYFHGSLVDCSFEPGQISIGLDSKCRLRRKARRRRSHERRQRRTGAHPQHIPAGGSRGRSRARLKPSPASIAGCH